MNKRQRKKRLKALKASSEVISEALSEALSDQETGLAHERAELQAFLESDAS